MVAVLVGFASALEPGFDAADTAILAPGTTFQDCSVDCPVMISIGPGSFQMGSTVAEEEKEKITGLAPTYPTPRHLVSIHYEFALGKFDVTRAEFAAFVRETHYRSGDDCIGYVTGARFSPGSTGLNWRNPGFGQTDRDPVVCVNWADAHAYLAWLSSRTKERYRLSSESEWEYAARAGSTVSRYWGDRITEACLYADVRDISFLSKAKLQPGLGDHFDCSDGYPYTAPVGEFRPNEFGLYDMLGNVRQLTEDCWNHGFTHSYVGAPADGSAWTSQVCMYGVTRGASFDETPSYERVSFRSYQALEIRSNTSGFRVARSFE